jgi:hypothetical protein
MASGQVVFFFNLKVSSSLFLFQYSSSVFSQKSAFSLTPTKLYVAAAYSC